MSTRLVLGSFLLLSCCLPSCVDPIVPEYDYLDGFIFMEGEVTDEPGLTQVRISESLLSFGQYTAQPQSGAEVAIVADDGTQITLTETEPGYYRAPDDFRGTTGTSYRLVVRLHDGRQYQSELERLPKPVAIDSLYPDFEPEYEYDEQRNQFRPAHRVRAVWQDPRGERNFYEWRYKVYKQTIVCYTCFGGIYRGGDTCIDIPELGNDVRYDYQCDGPCWVISYSNQIQTFGDDYIDGNTIDDREVAAVEYDTRWGVLVEVQQLAITPERHRFNRLLADLTTGSGGLNAPPPTAIIGNLTNIADPEEKVLGYFGAASTSRRRLYIDRTDTPGEGTGGPVLMSEPTPPPPDFIPLAPCREGRFRTAIKPEGWP